MLVELAEGVIYTGKRHFPHFIPKKPMQSDFFITSYERKILALSATATGGS